MDNETTSRLAAEQKIETELELIPGMPVKPEKVIEFLRNDSTEIAGESMFAIREILENPKLPPIHKLAVLQKEIAIAINKIQDNETLAIRLEGYGKGE